MRFYTREHLYYCGIGLHARSMYVCILDQSTLFGGRPLQHGVGHTTTITDATLVTRCVSLLHQTLLPVDGWIAVDPPS